MYSKVEHNSSQQQRTSILQLPPDPVYSLNEMAASICFPKEAEDYKPECLARICEHCRDKQIELTQVEKEHCQHIKSPLRCYKYVVTGEKECDDGEIRESKKLDYAEEDKTGQQLCDHLNKKQPGYPASHL